VEDVAASVDLAARALGLAVVAVAGVIALTHWGVRRGRIPAFGTWSKTVRRLSDPVLRPIERNLVRRGGNPQDATLWLFAGAVVLGLLVVSGIRWLVGAIYGLGALGAASPRIWIATAIGWAFTVLIAALFVRVIAGFLGASPFSRWMRAVGSLTEWLLGPIRRIVPPVGMIDLSPLVAYLVLIFARAVVLRLVAGA
jgi:YggT family protein